MPTAQVGSTTTSYAYVYLNAGQVIYSAGLGSSPGAPNEFGLQNTNRTPLSSGQECELTMSFTPAYPGVRSGLCFGRWRCLAA